MDDVAFARALHVLGVVIWIGGLAMVTTSCRRRFGAAISVLTGFRSSRRSNAGSSGRRGSQSSSSARVVLYDGTGRSFGVTILISR